MNASQFARCHGFPFLIGRGRWLRGARLAAALIGLIAGASTAQAATQTTIASGNWNNPAIWSPAGVPTNGDRAIIATGTTVTVTANVTIADVFVQAGAVLQGDGTLRTFTMGKGGGEDLTNNGTINFGGATPVTLNLNKDMQVGGAGGTWNFSIIDLNGKKLRFTNGTSFTLNLDGAGDPILAPGEFNTTGGCCAANANITVNYNGTAAQTLSTSANVDYGNLAINNPAGVSLARNLDATNLLGNVSVQSGVLKDAGFTITGQAGKTFSVSNGATFEITNAAGMVTGFGAKTFQAASTVDYRLNGNQPVSAETYGNLSLSVGGTKTPVAGTTTVAGNFTLGAGVTYAGNTNNPNYNLAGNFSNNGTFTSGTGTYTFNGSGVQTLTGATTFTNLTMSNTGSGLTLNNNLTVTTAAAGTLTFTSGVITTGANRVIVARACNNAASIVRTSGHVAGNVQLSFPAGANVSCTFPTGDASTYRPIATTFASITVAGNAIGWSSQAAGDHPNVATSDIDASKSVNRYWTLTNSGIAFTSYSATFNFVAGDLDAGVNTNALAVRRYSGGTWDLTTTTGTRTATSTQATGLTGFGDFAIGELNTVNHYFVSNAATGVNCAAENVTITAHNSAHAATAASGRTITITAVRVAGAAGNHGDWTLVTGAGTLTNGAADDGVATYTFASGESSVVLALKDTWVQTVNIAVTDGTATDTSGTASADAGYNQDLAFVNSGFRITDGGSPPAAATIGTQIAGTTSATYGLQAIRTDTSTGACVGVFGSGADVTVQLASQCNNPVACIAGQNVTITNNSVLGAIASNPKTSVTTYTSRSLRFGNSSQALFTLNYPDVGAISLYAKYEIPLGTGAGSGNFMTGSSTPFVVKPAGFTLSNILQTAAPNLANPGAADATGAKFVKAGEAFSVTVTAVNSAGTATPNYGQETSPETVRLSANLAGLGQTNNPALANPTAFGSFSAGVGTGTTFSWTETGIITLTPSVGDADYLGVGNVTGTTSGNVGRFYPDHLALSAATLTNRSTSACAPASIFTYMNEPMSLAFTLTAQGPAPGNVTLLNYVSSGTAANNFAKLATATPIPAAFGFGLQNGGTDLSARLDSSLGISGNWLAGVLNATATLAFSRNPAPDGPYAALKIGLAPVDSDGAQLLATALDLDISAPPGNDHAQAAQTQVRFGRMRLGNAFGSTLIDLPLPLSVEYYNGGVFVANASDSCTTLNASAIAFGFSGNLAACETQLNPSGSITFASGVGSVKLTRPGSGNDGSADLTVKLGSVPAGITCTSGSSSAATAANKPWLRGNWGSGTYTDDPRARATFGLFRGADPFIYLREVH